MLSMNPLASDWSPDAFWTVPLIGALVCALAYLLGRRLFVAPPPSVDDGDQQSEALFLQGLTRDRRAAPRRKGNIVEVELCIGADRQLMRGWVLDRSIGGLCLLVDQPVASGTVLRVRPRNAAAAVPWMEVTTCSCREEGDRFELGCQFHHTPNWSHLLMLG
jgi:hypothetical protein